MTDQAAGLVIGIPSELDPNEKRVAVVPATIPQLQKLGAAVCVQHDAGLRAGFPDAMYTAKGAEVIEDRDELFRRADIILQVRALGACGDHASDDCSRLRNDQILIAGCDPLSAPEPVREAGTTGAGIFALELVPRITRAQSMDVLSSMATIAGYRAVLLAALASPRMFPMMMTAAGTLKPARVLIIGAGVAGLQAIATAKRLGAVVYGYDIRPAVREQVESLGGKFVELDLETGSAEGTGGYAKQMDDDFYRRQRAAMKKVIADCDVVITTAAIPGRQAPVLVTTEMVEAMAPGSVIVDIAAERGGNCEVTVAGETITHHGVTVVGPVNLPSDVPIHASEMLSRNVLTFLQQLVKDQAVCIDLDDEVIRDTLLTRGGEVVNPRVRDLLGLPAVTPAVSSETEASASESDSGGNTDS